MRRISGADGRSFVRSFVRREPDAAWPDEKILGMGRACELSG